ncbi:MAG: PAS domain S-box protein, partial [Bacteroidetes bacterium]|nr:PAS domain S-box protein [Bacteroidota bacterium]
MATARTSIPSDRLIQLEELAARYATLTANIPVGLFRSTPGPTGRFIEVNPALAEILGFDTMTELLTIDVSSLYLDPLERQRFSDKLAAKGFVKNEELSYRKKDSTRIVVSETAIAVRDADGALQYFDGIVEDITERKRAEDELLVQKAYLEQLFNSAPEAVVLHDTNDRVVNINAEFTRLFGYARDEAVGRLLNELVAPAEFMDEASFLSDQVIHGTQVETESQRRRKDGQLIDVSILGAPILHDGKQMGVYAIYRNITERKKAEDALRIQKTYFERLFNSAPEAIALHSNTDRIANINREFSRMFGYTREEAIGRQINTLIVPASLQQEAADVSRRVLSGERIELDTKRMRKDGTLIDVSVLGAPIVHEGVQIGDYAIYRDIGERKRAEEELLVQKAYLEQLFNSAPEAIVLHDSDDRVVNVNTEFTQMFGYTREEAVGQFINDLVAPKKLRNEADFFSKSVIGGERIEADSQRRRKDGSLIDVSIMGAPIVTGGKQIGVYAIYRDITERKRAEESRIRAQEEARLARNIQLRLLPSEPPQIAGYDIAGKNLPALNVGG